MKKLMVTKSFEVTTTNDGKMLLGNQLKEQFVKEPYSEWHTKEFNEYALDQKAVGELKKNKINMHGMYVKNAISRSRGCCFYSFGAVFIVLEM